MSDQTDLRNTFLDQDPPPRLESRIIASLRQARVLGPRAGPLLRPLRVALLAAASLVVGLAIGRISARAPADAAGPRYLLLLYEDSTFVADRPMGEIVAEYAAWADSLGRAGRLDAGEKLGDARVVVGDVRMVGAAPTGFFVVRASTLDDARALAASSPHVRRGGTVHVTAIE